MASTKAHTGMPASQFVIPDSAAVIPDSATVIPDSIRDPVLRHHWIAGAETPDLIRGRNDSAAFDLIGSVMNFRNINSPPFFKAARQ